MHNLFKKIISSIRKKVINRKNEEKKLLKSIGDLPKNIKILDVGCGYGRNIELLKKHGYENILGVEKNLDIVDANKKNNMNCVSVKDFFSSSIEQTYDVILMSHIIEHFEYKDLKKFIEEYLSFLKRNGKLIIITPVFSKFFYDDFDHIKPYDPTGIKMVFGKNKAQVQIYSDYTLKLKNIYFRKSPYRLKYFRSLYINKNNRLKKYFLNGLNLLLAIMFKMSFGIIGYTSGWIGVFQKKDDNN